MKNAVSKFVPHGDARRLELIKENFVVRKLLIRPWFDRDTDWDTGLIRLMMASASLGSARK
jgi:hypothetical protein